MWIDEETDTGRLRVLYRHITTSEVTDVTWLDETVIGQASGHKWLAEKMYAWFVNHGSDVLHRFGLHPAKRRIAELRDFDNQAREQTRPQKRPATDSTPPSDGERIGADVESVTNSDGSDDTV